MIFQTMFEWPLHTINFLHNEILILFFNSSVYTRLVEFPQSLSVLNHRLWKSVCLLWLLIIQRGRRWHVHFSLYHPHLYPLPANSCELQFIFNKYLITPSPWIPGEPSRALTLQVSRASSQTKVHRRWQLADLFYSTSGLSVLTPLHLLHVLAINRACQAEVTLGAVTHAVFYVYNAGPLARLAFHTSVMSLVRSDPLWLVLLSHKVQHLNSLVYVLTLLYCAQLHISPQAIILVTKAGNLQ